MAKFVFKLEGVLQHRQNIERQRQRDLAIAQSQVTAMEDQLRALDAEVKSVNDDVRTNHLTGPIRPDFLIAHRRFQAAAQRQAMAIAEKLAAAQIKRDSARRALAEAARDHKVLERLKEKQHEAWQADLSRKEAAANDEIAVQMTFRQLEESAFD
jgi:flagellar FliJ protein